MHHNRSCSGTERNEEAWQELMEASLRMGRGLGPIQNFRLNAERGTGEEAQPPGETQACSCRPQFRKKKLKSHREQLRKKWSHVTDFRLGRTAKCSAQANSASQISRECSCAGSTSSTALTSLKVELRMEMSSENPVPDFAPQRCSATGIQVH